MTDDRQQDMDIARQRCFNHQQREAVARCPVCERFFCRECITEHDDRVICVACLHALMAARKPTRSIVRHGKTAAQCLAAFLLLWLLFFSIGQLLLRIPGSFHEGTLWNEWWD